MLISPSFSGRFPVLFLLILLLTVTAVDSLAAKASSARSMQLSTEGMHLLHESARDLQPDRLKLSQIDRLSGARAADRLDVLVVGCDFSDSLMWGRDLAAFPGWPEQSRKGHLIPGLEIYQFEAHDPVYFDIQMRKVRDYFATVSFGRFSMDWDVYPEIINLPQTMAYYGDSDSSSVRLAGMAQHIIDLIDPDVQFDSYDTLVLIHAGAGKETDILTDSPEQIFSNYLDRRDFTDALEAGILPADELSSEEGAIEHVLILPESESQDPYPPAGLNGFFGLLGVYCFEFGLRVGMLNLADFTPSEFVDSQGIGNFGLMAYGLYAGVGMIPSAPCAMNRGLMGWVEEVEVREDARVRIGAIGQWGDSVSDTLLVKIPINDREYWLVEYRLQDPNGDLYYSFADSNWNILPDYYDADSDSGNGWPTSPYDPAEDHWESQLGSEWDFFMSDNDARTDDRCMRGGGSGLYIWHIDERIIEDSILSGRNTINADPDHKGVDVEEADGLQDLDSAAPSEFYFGWDGDCFRGEGADEFGPDTRPSTETAEGLPTGIRIHSISKVVADSLPRLENGNCWAFDYHPALYFDVEFGATGGDLPLAAQHVYIDSPGRHSIRLADLGAVTGETSPAGEIVQAGMDGRIYAFSGDLQEWVDGDGDPLTDGVLAIASGPEGAPQWLDTPAVGDVDGDGEREIVLSAPSGIYVLEGDGSEWVDGDEDPGTFGLAWPSGEDECSGGPLLISRTERTGEGAAEILEIVQLVQSEDQLLLLLLSDSGSGFEAMEYPLAQGQWRSGATRLDFQDRPWLAAVARQQEEDRVILVDLRDPSRWGGLPLIGGHGGLPLLASRLIGSGSPSLAWVDSSGCARATELQDALPATGEPLLIRTQALFQGETLPVPRSPLSGGLLSLGGSEAFVQVAGDQLFMRDRSLKTFENWPYLASLAGEGLAGSPTQPEALLADLDADGRVEVLWHDFAGRLHAVDAEGQALTGWPVAGPAEPAGSPAVGDVDGDGLLELVAAGLFPVMEEIDAADQSVTVKWRGELRVYDLTATEDSFAPWAQARGNGHNSGWIQAYDLPVSGKGGGKLEKDSLIVQPNPATGDVIRIRARILQACEVSAFLYNLEGEEVGRVEPVFVAADSFYEEYLSVSGLAAGHYFCRIVAGNDAEIQTVARVR